MQINDGRRSERNPPRAGRDSHTIQSAARPHSHLPLTPVNWFPGQRTHPHARTPRTPHSCGKRGGSLRPHRLQTWWDKHGRCHDTIYTYSSAITYTYRRTYVSHVDTDIYVYIHIYNYISKFTCIHITWLVYRHEHVCVNIDIHTYIYIYTRVHTTCMCPHTHTRRPITDHKTWERAHMYIQGDY